MRIKSFALCALSIGLGLLAIEITFAQTSQASTPRTKVTELVTRSSSNPVTVGSTDSISPTDVVLVLDANIAQAYDPGSMLPWLNNNPDIMVPGGIDPNTLACDPSSFASLGGIGPYGNYSNANYYQNACVKACNDNGTCYPFKTVKDAAKAFIDQLRPGYDRIAIVNIDRQPQQIFDLSTNLQGAKDAIDAMRASDHFPGDTAGNPCPYINDIGNRWRCASSNMGGAIRLASEQLASSSARRVAVLLTTGAADTTDPILSAYQADAILYGVCPGRDSLPFCRDTRWATHHISNTVQYDAEDYAYDQANYLGVSSQYTQLLDLPNGGLDARIYTIGMGKRIVCTSLVDVYSSGPPVVCVPSATNQYVDPDTKIPPHIRGYSNGAESFLRYLADVGDDGDPTTTPCNSTAGAANALPLRAPRGN